MKKSISLLLCIVILLCIFTSTLPSFALSYGDFSYEIVDEEIVITGYSGTDTEITIPAEIDGVAVVKINDNAFKDNEILTSVIISEGVEDIGASAFENCIALETISLPSTVIHIGKNAIYNTAYYNDENNWKLDKNNTSSGDVNIGSSGTNDTILWEDILAPKLDYLYLGTALIKCEFSGTYRIKQGTVVVADGAFVGSVNAKKIVFPTSLVTIGNNAFYGCNSLDNVEVPQNVQSIGDYAFKDCFALETLSISETTFFDANVIYNTGFYNNPENWENNTLYMGTRVVGTKGTESVIKDGAITIISGALGNKNVVIPATVTNIHENAFTSTENVIVYGYTDTYAQTYANENNITFIDLSNTDKGDVNFDGKIDEEDYNILCSVSALQEYQCYAILLAGDMNEDGTIDGIDAIILDLFLNDIGPSTIKGDANGDGKVNEDDYDLLVKISSANAKITDNYMFHRCDLNDDGAVDGFDAMYLDLALNGLVAIL